MNLDKLVNRKLVQYGGGYCWILNSVGIDNDGELVFWIKYETGKYYYRYELEELTELKMYIEV